MDKRRLTCPTCGRPLRGWELRAGSVYGLGDTLPPGTDLERRQPARDPVPSDFVTAAGYAFLSLIILSTSGVITANLTRESDWIGRGVGAGALAMVVVWFTLLVGHQRLLWLVERITNLDIDQDGAVGPATPVILKAPRANVDSGTAPQLPITQDVADPNRRLALDLCEFLTRGESGGFSRSRWVGQTTANGTRVTDSTWREWTGWLSDADILIVDNAGTRLATDLDTALKCVLHDWKTA